MRERTQSAHSGLWSEAPACRCVHDAYNQVAVGVAAYSTAAEAQLAPHAGGCSLGGRQLGEQVVGHDASRSPGSGVRGTGWA